MTTLSVPVLGDCASALIRFTRASSKWIIFRWCLLCLLVFIVYGGCISALYFLLKYNPEDMVYGVCVIATVQCLGAAIIGAEAGGLMQETRAAWASNERPVLDN